MTRIALTGTCLPLALLGSCVHTKHDVEMSHRVEPVRVEPIEVNVNVNVRVQIEEDLDQVFDEIDEASTTVAG